MSLEDFTRLETLAAEPEEERNGVILSRANALIDTRNTERSRARTIVDVIRKGDFDTAQQLLGRKQVVETPGAAKLSAQEKAADPLERAKRTLMREIQRAGLDKPFTSPAELNTTLRHLHMKTGAEASIPVGEPFTAQVKEGGFFSKLLGGGEKERTFQLYMTPDGQASRVEYIGADSNDPKVQKQYKQYIP